MSALLNLVGLVLILPNLALALFFLAVGAVAEQKTLGGIAAAFWSLLGRLPAPEYLPFILLALVAAVALLVVALVRVPLLLPLIVVAVGVASLIGIGQMIGWRELAGNPVNWLGVAGVSIAAWQLWRSTMVAA